MSDRERGGRFGERITPRDQSTGAILDACSHLAIRALERAVLERSKGPVEIESACFYLFDGEVWMEQDIVPVEVPEHAEA